jgi:hypothetical protein
MEMVAAVAQILDPVAALALREIVQVVKITVVRGVLA